MYWTARAQLTTQRLSNTSRLQAVMLDLGLGLGGCGLGLDMCGLVNITGYRHMDSGYRSTEYR